MERREEDEKKREKENKRREFSPLLTWKLFITQTDLFEVSGRIGFGITISAGLRYR